MMDCFDCNICNVPYDEEHHRPRQVPCGHSLCSVCLMALINDMKIFECPTCRKKVKVEVSWDLAVNYDLLEVIRAFKTKMVSLTKETETNVSVATNDAICYIHSKAICYWCKKCLIWLCIECLELHTLELGCFTIMSAIAVYSMKKESIGSIDALVRNFEEDTKLVSLKIQQHADKKNEYLEMAEKHCNEEKKLGKVIEQGQNPKKLLLEAKKQLNELISPYAVSQYIKIVAQRKQILRSWSVKNNVGMENQLDIKNALKGNRNVYVECLNNKEKMYGKLSLHEDNVYFHKFHSQKIENGSIIMPFDRLQQLIPSDASLVFLEMSLGGKVKGHVLLRLRKDLPNIRKNLVTIFTGPYEYTLQGIKCDCANNLSLRTASLPFRDIPVTADRWGTSQGNRGDINAYFPRGYVEKLYFLIGSYEYPYRYNRIIGCIESGMDIIQECHKNQSQGVVITDCGLVIENE